MGFATGRARSSALLAVLAAFAWASYYYFVLNLGPASRPAAVLSYPFLLGGAGYAVFAAYRGQLRAFVAMFRSASAYLRTLLLVGMQVSVLASTYTAGPIDTSLLSLVGDVALTPLLLMVVYREGVDRSRSPSFLGGLILSSAGAALTIVGGQTLAPISGVDWLVVLVVPVTVALYFLLSAKASIASPTSAVVGQSLLTAGVISAFLSPLVPGGAAGLYVPSGHDLIFLVGLGVSSFFIAPALYFEAVERAGLILPALLMATIPMFTLFVEIVGFNTAPNLIALLGVPIAVFGGLLAIRGSHPGWVPEYGTVAEGSAK